VEIFRYRLLDILFLCDKICLLSNSFTTNNLASKEDDMRKREERIGFEIRRLDHMLARSLQARVKAAGIDEVTLMHGWIIRYLYTNRDKDVFQKDMEQYFSIGRSTVTNIIQLMEKKGFIVRQSVEYDARLKKVVLTEKGVRNHEMLENLIDHLDTSLVEGITDEELSVFYSVIEKLRENLNSQSIKECANGGKEEIDDPNFIA
jgi:Transcriptional regulators